MTQKKSLSNNIWTVIFSILSVLYMYPIVMVVLNSLKVETAISTSTAIMPPIMPSTNNVCSKGLAPVSSSCTFA